MNNKILLDDHGSEIIYLADWLEKQIADNYFKIILNKITWQEEAVVIFGKKVTVPRLVAWHGDLNANYSYSGIQHQPLPWFSELLALKTKIQQEFNLGFNSVLANLYRNGYDYMGWHSDAEKSLGLNPVIASISLGVTRKFLFRNKNTKAKFELILEHGSLLIMSGTIQHYWQHQLPKALKVTDPRINLTFRKIIG